jgi:hypothetical protein
MDQEAGKRLWHFGKRIAGFQPAEIFLTLPQAVGLGYWIFAPLAQLKCPNSSLEQSSGSSRLPPLAGFLVRCSWFVVFLFQLFSFQLFSVFHNTEGVGIVFAQLDEGGLPPLVVRGDFETFWGGFLTMDPGQGAGLATFDLRLVGGRWAVDGWKIRRELAAGWQKGWCVFLRLRGG